MPILGAEQRISNHFNCQQVRRTITSGITWNLTGLRWPGSTKVVVFSQVVAGGWNVSETALRKASRRPYTAASSRCLHVQARDNAIRSGILRQAWARFPRADRSAQ